MRALVTGSVGFIGCHLCSRLVGDGWEVLGVDIRAEAQNNGNPHSFLAERKAFAGVRHLAGDVRDSGWVREVAEGHRPDVIFHLAAIASVHDAERDAQLCYDTNIGGTESVLRAASHVGARVVFASSSAVYGNDIGNLCPLGVYGKSKFEAEQLCSKSGLTSWVLRPFTVFGKFGREDMAAWRFASQIQNGEAVTLRQGSVRDMVDVRDTVRAFMLAGAPMQSADLNVADIGTGVGTDMGDFAGMIADALRLPLRVTTEKLPAFEAVSTRADLRRGKGLSWAPEIPAGKAVADFVEWYKEASLRR
jgi:UDP-glucuronate 4-epimerase